MRPRGDEIFAFFMKRKSNEATEATEKSVADFSASESTCSLEKGWLCSANVSKSVNVFALIPLLTQKKKEKERKKARKDADFPEKKPNVGQEDSQQIINLAIAY